MESGGTPSLGLSHCFARLFLSFALCVANLYDVPLAKCHKMWRWRQMFTGLVCLSLIVSLSFTFVIFSSLSKPLFPCFISPSILTVHTRNVRMKHSQNLNSLSIVFYRSHSLYMRRTKPWQTWMASRAVPDHDRLDWLLNRILLFSQFVDAAYETMTDYQHTTSLLFPLTGFARVHPSI